MRLTFTIVFLFACLSILPACSKDRASRSSKGGKAGRGGMGSGVGMDPGTPHRKHSYNCDDLRVEVEGKPLRMVRGYGFRSGKYLSVELINHEKVTCRQILTGSRFTQRGEISVGASWAEGERHNVSTGGRNKSTVVSVLKEPKKVGDDVALCLSEPVLFSRGVGKPKITVSGLFLGKYCGEMKQR